MLYNVSIMVNLWGALTSRDVRLLKNQIDKLDSLPENCWFVILNAMDVRPPTIRVPAHPFVISTVSSSPL